MKSPAELLKERSAPPLQYSEPSWGGKPPEGKTYTLEELKSGTIVKVHNLSEKSFFVIGRLPVNDIQLEHPSLSRFHAVVQYRVEASEDQPVGFYLYDLGSTHGTFHNKSKCYPQKYYRLRVGHNIKAGGSTRLLILQGPDDDMEDESALTVTELKELSAQKAKLAKALKGKDADPKEEHESEHGCAWGMGEDATEEEEQLPDMTKNPFSLQATADEHLDLEDPKKTLRGWFEREGYELEYNVQDKGHATFVCTIELPINEIMGVSGAPNQAEFTTKGGKKKDCVVQCALEACKILNRYGLLRQSNHESRAKRQIKKWKDNDYYDSDEDEFLDRTGAIQSKRQKRMETEDKTAATTVDTYETLKEKLTTVQKAKAQTEAELAAAIQALNETKKLSQEQENDDLDTFMVNLQKTQKGQGGKESVSRLKQVLLSHSQEIKKLEKLIEITKPTQMPQLQLDNSPASSKKGLLGKGVMIGKRWGLGSAKNIRTIQVVPKAKVQNEDPSDPSAPKKSPEVDASKDENHEEKQDGADPTDEVPQKEASTQNHEMKSSKESTIEAVKGPSLPVSEMEIEEPKPAKKKRPRKREEIKIGDEEKVVGEYDVSDPKYATWIPPTNQSGDGRTSLNDKYGY